MGLQYNVHGKVNWGFSTMCTGTGPIIHTPCTQYFVMFHQARTVMISCWPSGLIKTYSFKQYSFYHNSDFCMANLVWHCLEAHISGLGFWFAHLFDHFVCLGLKPTEGLATFLLSVNPSICLISTWVLMFE